MKFARFFRAAALCLAAAGLRPAGAHAEAGPVLNGAGKPANVLNPNISVIGDFVAGTGPRGDGDANKASLREAEVGLQANVDPYARADFFLSIPEGGSLEVEEGYVTLLTLPWGLQAKGGKFKAAFGRMNTIHGHERPQVDDPFVIDQYLGEEGVRDTGAEVSRIFAPLGVFTELSYGLLNGLGEEAAPGRTVFVRVTDQNGAPLFDVNGNPLVKPVTLADDDPSRPRSIRSFAHVARARFYGDITDSANVDLGLSGALHEPEGDKQVRMAAADLTFRWRPPQWGLYRGLIWRTEGIYSDRVLPEAFDITGAKTSGRQRLDRRGAYAYVDYQATRRWRFGVRGDYSEDPEAKDALLTLGDGSTREVKKSITRGVSPAVTYTLSEFNRIRFELQRKTTPSGEVENRGWLQWTVVLGPHGAHPF